MSRCFVPVLSIALATLAVSGPLAAPENELVKSESNANEKVAIDRVPAEHLGNRVPAQHLGKLSDLADSLLLRLRFYERSYKPRDDREAWKAKSTRSFEIELVDNPKSPQRTLAPLKKVVGADGVWYLIFPMATDFFKTEYVTVSLGGRYRYLLHVRTAELFGDSNLSSGANNANHRIDIRVLSADSSKSTFYQVDWEREIAFVFSFYSRGYEPRDTREEWNELPTRLSSLDASLRDPNLPDPIQPVKTVQLTDSKVLLTFPRAKDLGASAELQLHVRAPASWINNRYLLHFAAEDLGIVRNHSEPPPDFLLGADPVRLAPPIREERTNDPTIKLTWNGEELAIGLGLAEFERLIPKDLYSKVTTSDGVLVVFAPNGIEVQLEPGDVSFLLGFRGSRLAQIDKTVALSSDRTIPAERSASPELPSAVSEKTSPRQSAQEQLVDYRSILGHSMAEVESYLATTGTKEAEDEFFDYVYVTQFGTVEASYRGNRAYECSISLNAPFSDYVAVLRSVGIRRVTKPFRMSDARLLFTSNLGNALLTDFPDVIVGVFIPEDGAKSGWIVRFLQQ